MADLVPIQTNVSDPATWNAAGMIDALIAHTWGANWSVVTSNAGQGVALQCDLAGEAQTVIIRKATSGSAANLQISVSEQVIDNAGNDTPTVPTTSEGGGGSALNADWSGEFISDCTIGTPATGSKMWILEYPDAFLIFWTDPTNAFMLYGIHAGRIYQPQNANSSALGQDGLGAIAGQMIKPSTAATANAMFSNKTSGGASEGALHYETNKWGFAHTLITPAASHAPDGTDGETNIFVPGLIVTCDIGGQVPIVGHYKYVRLVGTVAQPKTIKPVTASNQGYLHFNNVTGTTTMHATFICDKTKTV